MRFFAAVIVLCFSYIAPAWALYESDILSALVADRPVTDTTPHPDYPVFLRAAIGWDAPQLAAQPLSYTATYAYEGETAWSYRIAYDTPAVDVRFVYAKHADPVDTLVVILHGHSGSANQVMGWNSQDYMNRLGQFLFRENMDVIAFDAISDGDIQSRIGVLLAARGMHNFGLFGRAVCDSIVALGADQQYSRIVLHGFSVGGMLVDQISVLCDNFDAYIVGDIFHDWKYLVQDKYDGQCCHKNYLAYFLEPLLEEASYVDPVLNSRAPKYYTRNPTLADVNREALQPLLDRGNLCTAPGVDHSAQINFVYRDETVHVVDRQQVLDIIRGNPQPGEHLVECPAP